MARVGVLSDAAVKIHCPEMFPLPTDQYKLFQPTKIPHSSFDGVKPDKRFKDFGDFARFPDHDFRNFGNISAVNNREVAALNAILNYRRGVGSKNLPNVVGLEGRQAFQSVRSGENQTGQAPMIVNLSQVQPTGKAPAPATSTATGSALTVTTPTGGGSSSMSGVTIGPQTPTSSQLNFAITARTRKEQQANFLQYDIASGRDEKKFFNAQARAYMGAFPDDTISSITAHFAKDFPAIRAGALKVHGNDVHTYMLSKNPTADERRELEGLLNRAKKARANTMMGSVAAAARRFMGATQAQIEAELEDDE